MYVVCRCNLCPVIATRLLFEKSSRCPLRCATSLHNCLFIVSHAVGDSPGPDSVHHPPQPPFPFVPPRTSCGIAAAFLQWSLYTPSLERALIETGLAEVYRGPRNFFKRRGKSLSMIDLNENLRCRSVFLRFDNRHVLDRAESSSFSRWKVQMRYTKQCLSTACDYTKRRCCCRTQSRRLFRS